MRIDILNVSTKDWQYLAYATHRNICAYCFKHRYGFIAVESRIPYDGYQKIEAILEQFGSIINSLVIMCVDLDVLITNYNIKIEDFLDDEHDFYICKDYNGINAGVFIIRKSEWSITFLNWILKCRGKEKMYCEQDAIAMYMRLFPNDKKIKIVPHPAFNSYLYENYPEIPPQPNEGGQWREGDFLLHLPGMSNEKRIEIFSRTKIIDEPLPDCNSCQ